MIWNILRWRFLDRTGSGMFRGGGNKRRRNRSDAREKCLDKCAYQAQSRDEIVVQYDEILVDEYQDSNLVQETLIQVHQR